MMTCNSVVISHAISSPTSLYMVSFPFPIVRNTCSFHILSKLLIFIRHKQGYFNSPPPPISRQYGKYSTAYGPIKLQDFHIRIARCHSYIIIFLTDLVCLRSNLEFERCHYSEFVCLFISSNCRPVMTN